MTPEQRADFASELREKLNSLRSTFTVDRYMFEPYVLERQGVGCSVGGPRKLETADDVLARPKTLAPRLLDQAPRLLDQKVITAAAVKLLLDYCESNWDMGFKEYCFGIFQAREPMDSEEAFDALPDTRERMNAERLGFGAIYRGSNGK